MNENIDNENSMLFKLLLIELERIQKDHCFSTEELAKSLLMPLEELEQLLKGNISLFTPRVWLRAVSALAVDSPLFDFIETI